MADASNRSRWGITQPSLGLQGGLNTTAGGLSKGLWIAWSVCIVLLVAVVGYLFSEHCGWVGKPAHVELQHVASLLSPQQPAAETIVAVQAYLQSVLGPNAVLASTSSTAVLPPASAISPISTVRYPTTAPPTAPKIIMHDTISKGVTPQQARGDGL
jgi:hypothetical protein